MKKLLCVLVIGLLFGACSPNLVEVENPKKETNVEVIENITDTLALSVNNGIVSLIDIETSLVKYKFKQAGYSDGYVVTKDWFLFILIMGIAFVIVFIVIAIIAGPN